MDAVNQPNDDFARLLNSLNQPQNTDTYEPMVMELVKLYGSCRKHGLPDEITTFVVQGFANGWLEFMMSEIAKKARGHD